MTTTPAQDPDLLAAARAGDEHAYQRLVEPHRGELHAHCYRMLGSTHDAEDALQETLLRAWRGLARFEGRSSLRSWLYKIATNTSLNAVEKRRKRVLPIDYGPASDPHAGPASRWSSRCGSSPTRTAHGIDDGAGPEARYEQREAHGLASSPPCSSAAEPARASASCARCSATRPGGHRDARRDGLISSALQQARGRSTSGCPTRTSRRTLRELGDDETKELVGTYVDAWLRDNVDAVVRMLTDDVSFAMPPLGTWFSGNRGGDLPARPDVGRVALAGLVSQANGQPAIA